MSGAPIELPPPPPLRSRSVGEILTAAFDLYGRSWRTLIPLVAVVVVPLSILQSAIGDALGGDDPWQAATGRLLIVLVGLFATLVVAGAVAWAAAGVLVGRETDLGEAYRFGTARMWSLLLVGVLVGLAVAGGFVLLVVPGFIFLTRFSVSVVALVVEGKRGRAALSRSWSLVRGHSWSVFGTWIVAGFLAGIVNGALSAPFPDSWFARGLMAGIGSAITTPFTSLVISLIYFDLRVRKESLDVAGLERELRAATP
jgi:hypothetical protein